MVWCGEDLGTRLRALKEEANIKRFAMKRNKIVPTAVGVAPLAGPDMREALEQIINEIPPEEGPLYSTEAKRQAQKIVARWVKKTTPAAP